MKKITKELQETLKANDLIKYVWFDTNAGYFFNSNVINDKEAINGISIDQFEKVSREEILKAKI